MPELTAEQLEDLLRRYIAHVGNCEGVAFLRGRIWEWSDCELTEAEVRYMRQLSEPDYDWDSYDEKGRPMAGDE